MCHLHLEAVAVIPHCAVKGSHHTSEKTIVRLQKQNKSIREIAGTLGVAKLTVWYILRKKERTSELSNIKRPGRPRRTTVVDDRRILSTVKKKPFTTSS